MERTSFVFHKEWRLATKNLPTDVRAEIYDAIIEYGLSGTVPAGMKPMAGVAFNFIKDDIDKDLEKYTAICERNRANGRRSKGRPKTQRNPKKPSGLSGLSEQSEKPSEIPLYKGVPEEKPSGLFGLLHDGKSSLIKERKDSFPSALPNLQKKENNTYISAREEEVSFEEFWNAYGYKKSKLQAEKAWKRLSPADKSNALASIPAYKADCQSCGRSMKYPATYLNGRTWEDDFNSNNNPYATTKTNQQPYHDSDHPTNDELRQQTADYIASYLAKG